MTSQPPLAEIRSAELAAARSVAAAADAAERLIAAARSEAVRLVDDAKRRGRGIAVERHDAALAAARVEAEQIAASVEERIEALRRSVAPEIDRLVDAMLDVVLPRQE